MVSGHKGLERCSSLTVSVALMCSLKADKSKNMDAANVYAVMNILSAAWTFIVVAATELSTIQGTWKHAVKVCPHTLAHSPHADTVCAPRPTAAKAPPCTEHAQPERQQAGLVLLSRVDESFSWQDAAAVCKKTPKAAGCYTEMDIIQNIVLSGVFFYLYNEFAFAFTAKVTDRLTSSPTRSLALPAPLAQHLPLNTLNTHRVTKYASLRSAPSPRRCSTPSSASSSSSSQPLSSARPWSATP